MEIAPLATAQLVASVVNTAKAARDLARDTTNHELKEKIGEVYEGLMDLRERLLNVDEENRRLKVELTKRAEIDGPVPPFGYFFDKRHPEDPLCPRCYQATESRIAYMGPQYSLNGSVRRDCRLCAFVVREQEPDRRPLHQLRPRITPYT